MRRKTKALITLLSVSTTLTFSYAIAENKADDFSLLADDLKYSNKGSVVTATGNVSIVSDRGQLWAESLVYNTDTGIVKAKGNVVYSDKDNITIYLEEIILNNQLKAVELENIQVQLGSEGKKGPKLAAKKAIKNADDTLTLEGAVYSPCEGCGDDENLPWKIRAGKIEYNKAKGIATYSDAILDVYGVPVIYLPYFRHSIDEKPQDGLLMPRFGSSTNRGFEVKTAYYKRISDNQDLTTRLRYMTEHGAMLIGEHRLNTKNIYSTIKASAINDDKSNTWRSHLETESEYVFKKGRRVGANLNLASDDNYLDEFFEVNPSHLTNTLYAEDTSPDHYYGAVANFYQDQTIDGDDDRTAQVLPKLTFERNFNFDHNKTNSFTISANILSLSRSEGTNSQRLVTEAEYSDNFINSSGSKFSYTASLRSDIYNIDTDIYSTSGESGIHGRIVPQLSLQWEKPFISESMYHKITPKMMLVASPRGGNPNEIPNEDSVAYELDTSNLFERNRFAGFDRIETGSRFIYGVDNSWGSPNLIKWRLFLGQSYRFIDDSDLPTTGGTETRVSDWVGRFEGKPYEWLGFNAKFRLDNATFDARRLDNSITFGDRQNTYLTMTHSQLDDGPEEVKINGRYRFSKKYDFQGEIHRDLRDGGRFLNTEGQINYTQQCYRLSFKARRRGFDNVNVPPSTDYLLNLELLTLGRDYD